MFKSALLCALLTASFAFASPSTSARRVCGNHLSDKEVSRLEDDFAAKRVKVSSSKVAATTIPVHFHIIQLNSSLSGGNIPDSQLNDQISVLNKAYADSGLSFTLAGVDRTTNAAWFHSVGPDDSSQTMMKQTLRIGGAADLNVYTVGLENEDREDPLGYATFPANYASNATDDGIVLRYSTFPGGTLAPYNLGQTLTHEVGHWVGLYHTFQGGCESPGDSVSDTPPEAEPSFGCPTGRDTCSGDSEVDPIHNFMDYSDDSCLSQFTAGQIERLRSQMVTYRGVSL